MPPRLRYAEMACYYSTMRRCASMRHDTLYGAPSYARWRMPPRFRLPLRVFRYAAYLFLSLYRLRPLMPDSGAPRFSFYAAPPDNAFMRCRWI